MDKTLLRAALLRQLEADLALQTNAAMTSRDEATHEESKPENQYDMHAQEAAYLAEGQARMVAELRETLGQYAALELTSSATGGPIKIGSLVTLNAQGGEKLVYFIGPRGGGLEVEIDGVRILVVTPASPLGRQLLGRRAGDTLQPPGRKALGALNTIATVE